jgi:hypothetical protein
MSTSISFRRTTEAPPAATSVTTTPRASDEDGIRFGIAEAALVGALLVASLFRLDQQLTLALVAVTTVSAGALVGPVWAAGLGVSAWAMFTGFAEHTFGILTFAGPDLLRLGLLVVGCALVAQSVKWCAQWWAQWRANA